MSLQELHELHEDVLSMSTAVTRLGIMGGTFDPIHVAHVAVAEAVLEQARLDRIMFIPAADPPHKKNQAITPWQHRLAMTRLAVAGKEKFLVSDIEGRREGPSYSFYTIKALRQLMPKAEFYFITGTDELNDLPDWYQAGELLAMCHFIMAARPGIGLNLEPLVKAFGPLAESNIHQAMAPLIPVSSTEIRQRLRRGESVDGLVTPEVAAYIKREGLYRDGAEGC